MTLFIANTRQAHFPSESIIPLWQVQNPPLLKDWERILERHKTVPKKTHSKGPCEEESQRVAPVPSNTVAILSARRVAHCLLVLLVAAVVIWDGPIVVGLDDTIEGRWGTTVKARDIYREGGS
jgi:hypothetical protein